MDIHSLIPGTPPCHSFSLLLREWINLSYEWYMCCVNMCRDYVTGFRKRKQQRRKEAIKSLEKLQRESRLEERAEVRGVLESGCLRMMNVSI